jgi:hypothetical protein
VEKKMKEEKRRHDSKTTQIQQAQAGSLSFLCDSFSFPAFSFPLFFFAAWRLGE